MGVSDASDGTRRIQGRVVACDARGMHVDAGAGVALLAGNASEVRPGDLVDIVARDSTLVEMRIVRRALHEPFQAGTETGAFIAGGLRTRLEARARALAAIRVYFAEQKFLEVETPSFTHSPGLDLHLHAFRVVDDDYLITSPEYHMKRLLVGGVERCFQFARCFRARESGRRHEPEFTMLEWYRAWDDAATMMHETVELVRAAARACGNEDLARDRGFDVSTVREAFARAAPDAGDAVRLAEREEARYFELLSTHVEPTLGRDRPTFLTAFPARHASLAQIDPADATVSLRFEMYISGVEISNGFVELTDSAEQRARFERDVDERSARGLAAHPIDERFLAALEEGMPPSVGNALGFDRLVALLLGRDAVGDVMAFPAARR